MASSFPTNPLTWDTRSTTLGGGDGGVAHSDWSDSVEDTIGDMWADLAPVSQTLTLASGVTNFGSGYATGVAYRSGGLVTLSGKLVNTSGSTIAAGTAIAQAPDGYRPPFRLSFTIWAGTPGAILADVLTNGQVVIVSYDFLNGAYVSLDGICYQAV